MTQDDKSSLLIGRMVFIIRPEALNYENIIGTISYICNNNIANNKAEHKLFPITLVLCQHPVFKLLSHEMNAIV